MGKPSAYAFKQKEPAVGEKTNTVRINHFCFSESKYYSNSLPQERNINEKGFPA